MVVDYSLERVDNSPASRHGKFIHILHQNEHIIVMAALKECHNHKDILQKYCKLNGLPYNNHTSPASSEAVSVMGGGFWRAEDKVQRLEIDGKSLDYGNFNYSKVVELILNSTIYKKYKIG